MEAHRYIVDMHANRYRKFSNYEDLLQEGYEGLAKALKTFKQNKGNFFFWAHKYVGTKINRAANQHTTIRFPMRVARANPPRRESITSPNVVALLETNINPEKIYSESEIEFVVHQQLDKLSSQESDILKLMFGIDTKKKSVKKIAEEFGLRICDVKHISNKAMDKLMFRISID